MEREPLTTLTMNDERTRGSVLSLRFLGEMEIRRGKRVLPLPQSKKTRALLAYLVLNRRPHRRERLCSLLWDVTDDPRGALRWSLSKLRALVDDPGHTRLVADRDSVAFDLGGAHIDVVAASEELAHGAESLATERLVELARDFRGELLEGLDLGGFLEFQAWCVAVREDARQLHTLVLRALIERLAERPGEALAHARTLAEVDPLDEDARATLVRLLTTSGRAREAEEQYRNARRTLEELRRPLSGALERAWSGAAGSSAPEKATPAPADSDTSEETRAPLVGRRSEVARLLGELDEVRRARQERIVLLTGEPGVGKSRLLAELIDGARKLGGTVLDGCAFEVEAGRPYGPWVDALRRLPPLVLGPSLGPELAPLLPELGPEPSDPSSRDRLFGSIVEILAARAHSAPPVVVVLDDVQWCDAASASLLHYVARMNQHRPLLIALAARAGELPDNAPMSRALRALRREAALSEIRLRPLDQTATEELVRAVAPGADGARVFAASGGNPLFALEAARAPLRADDVPPTLSELVRERLERLPAEAAHVLRWAAVLGPTFVAERLGQLAAMDLEKLVGALETLERHALLRAAGHARESQGSYAFAHEVVRGVVYGDLSAPRRSLMHHRVAEILQALPQTDDGIAADIALHAAKAGDGAMAARACVAAGKRCLRLFADTEADAFARNGMHHAESTREPERLRLLLELHRVAVAARRPERIDETARQIEHLAEQAVAHGCLEHARLGFHLVSWLRWEHGEWSDAHHYMMQAERVSRAGDARERVVAMAEAARCLALVERDLGQADALLLEAGATAKRLGVEAVAIPDGLGMLRLHQGNLDEARLQFEQALELAQREGDHEGEFQALAHLVELEIELERWRDAAARAVALTQIAAKLRGGSEGPFAAALAALCDCAAGDAEAHSRLEEAITALRAADAKHRLAFVLNRAATLDLMRRDTVSARRRAEEALRAAEVLEATSELARAHVLLASADAGDESSVRRHREAVAALSSQVLSAQARAATAALLGTATAQSQTGTRRRTWKTSSSREPLPRR